MNIEVQNLPDTIVRGARAAYYANCSASDSTSNGFEAWLGRIKCSGSTVGGRTVVDEILASCAIAYHGDSQINIADLPPQDRDAIIVTYRVLQGMEQLDDLIPNQ